MKTFLFLFLVVLTACCIENYEVKNEMQKNVLIIIASKNFRDEEFEEPYKILSKIANITIASSSLKEAKGMLGKVVKPNITINDVDVRKYDAVIFVGGSGATEYFENDIALEIARKAYENNKIIGAICIAPVILANSGILNGKKATVWNGEFVKILKEKGAIYTGNDVEIDGKIITANGPNAAKKFGEKIYEMLQK
jgi:protease I